jgi:hypothetical protein
MFACGACPIAEYVENGCGTAEQWSLTSLREELVKIGANVTRHANYVSFQLAEVAITRKLLAAIFDRIEQLSLPPPAIHGGCYKRTRRMPKVVARGKIHAR